MSAMAERKKIMKGSYQPRGDLGFRLNFAEEFIDVSARSSQEIGFTAMDIYENKDLIFVIIELAGVSPDDVTVTVTENRLLIEGAKHETVCDEQGVTYHCAERSFGNFRRVFVLGSAVDSQNIKAAYKTGLLKLQIPKMPERRKRSHPINVKIDE